VIDESLGPVHHVGIACRDIESVRGWVHRTHDVEADSGVVWDEIQGAHLCLIMTSSTRLELVSGGPASNSVRRGQSLHHLCYLTQDLDRAILRLESDDCLLVSGPSPAVLFEGRRVAFLFGPLGLFELLEGA